jgi:hypothetical protein
MSNLDVAPPLMACGGRGGIGAEPVRELLAGREVTIGESTGVRRLLPNLRRRMVGTWCFVDHYGRTTSRPDPVCRCRPIRTPGCRRSAGSWTVKCCTLTDSVASTHSPIGRGKGVPSPEDQGEGQGSGEEPGSAAVKDSPA